MRPFNYAKRRIVECDGDFTLKTAVGLFVDENCGSILVKDSKGEYIGLLTDTAVFRAISEGLDLSKMTVSEIGLEPIVRLDKNADIDEVMSKFNECGSTRILMVDSGSRIVGILKRSNLERFSAYRLAHNMLGNTRR